MSTRRHFQHGDLACRQLACAPSTPRYTTQHYEPSIPSSPFSSAFSSSNETPTPTSSPTPIPSPDAKAKCRSLYIPLDSHVLHLGIHPDWRPASDSVVYLARDSAIVSLSEKRHRPSPLKVEYQPIAHSHRQRQPIPLISLILAVLLLLAYILGIGHPSWVIPIQETRPSTHNLTEPIAHMYDAYEQHLLPLVTVQELAHNPLMPMAPRTIFGVFKREMFQIKRGLFRWQASSLPGPETELVASIESCEKASLDILHYYQAFVDAADAILQAQSVQLLSNALDTQEAVFSVARFWEIEKRQNNEAREALVQVNQHLNTLNLAIDPLFVAIETALRPKAGSSNWIDDTLDAISFSRTHILRIIDSVVCFITHSISLLSAVDEELDTQIPQWRMLMEDNSATVWRGLGWVVRRTKTLTLWSFANGTKEELGRVAQRGQILGREIVRSDKARWEYAERRPLRPSQREKEIKEEKKDGWWW